MPKTETVNVVNKYTGEVYTFEYDSPESEAQAYASIQETIKALERAKNKLRDKVLTRMVGDVEPVDQELTWRRSVRRYANYDLTVMRNVLDEDAFQLYIKPDKKALDEAIKEAVANPESPVVPLTAAKELRDTMVEERVPSVALTLERSKGV